MTGRVFDGYLLKKDGILHLLGVDLFLGLRIKTCWKIFRQADFDLLQGPSVIYRQANPEKC